MRTRAVPVVPMAAQWALLGLLLWVLAPGPTGVAGVLVAVAGAAVGWVLLVQALGRHGRRGLGPADHVTVTRGTLACVMAALTTSSVLDGAVADPSGHGAVALRTPLVVLASVALSLDALDGWVARRTGTASGLGARLDMEVDAFLILVLSIAASLVLGWWVMVIGLFRYALAGATRVAPWLGSDVPPRYWRKAVAALQGIVLAVATAEVLPRPAVVGVVVLALLLLAWSFGTQVAELWRARAARSTPAGARTGAAQPTPVVVEAGPGQRVRAAP